MSETNADVSTLEPELPLVGKVVTSMCCKVVCLLMKI
jgi:hypothetical protein